MLLAAGVVMLCSASAAVTFELTFPDVVNNTRERWDDPTYGSMARQRLQEVLNEFGRTFAESAVIQLVITSSMATEYSAGAYTATHQLEPGGRFYDGNTYIKIRTGTDINGSAADGGIEYSFNFGPTYRDWNSDGVIDIRDFTLNLKGLTRHEILHIVGLETGIDTTTPRNSRVTRHNTFLFDSAGRPFVKADGTLSSTANFDDPNSYFDTAGSRPNYRIRAPGDFAHLDDITFPFREEVNAADRAYLATLGYPLAPPVGKLLNISTRISVGRGDAVMIAGFIVTGEEPKQLVIRALGPSLGAIGVDGALPNPRLDVYNSADQLYTLNDDWKNNQRAELEETGLAPANDFEAAAIRTFPPGAYTAVVSGEDGGTGVGSVEVYDMSAGSDSRMANISTRGFVGTGDNVMIGGFIIGEAPSQNAELLIRALGPSLSAAGVPNRLGDPILALYDSNGTKFRENDDWRDTQRSELEESGFAPAAATESAILLSRPAGVTTAIVRGKNGGTGNALIEVYRLR